MIVPITIAVILSTLLISAKTIATKEFMKYTKGPETRGGDQRES